MYKTVKLDLTAKFDLNREFWVEIVPSAWLPKSVTQQMGNLYTDSAVSETTPEEMELLEKNDPEAIKRAVDQMDDQFAFLAKSLTFLVVDWNLIDKDDHKLDIPKVLQQDGDELLIKKLAEVPMALLQYIFESAQAEDYSAIPLVKSKQQVPPSPAPMLLHPVEAALEPEAQPLQS